jgi:hypothetical protein
MSWARLITLCSSERLRWQSKHNRWQGKHYPTALKILVKPVRESLATIWCNLSALPLVFGIVILMGLWREANDRALRAHEPNLEGTSSSITGSFPQVSGGGCRCLRHMQHGDNPRWKRNLKSSA